MRIVSPTRRWTSWTTSSLLIIYFFRRLLSPSVRFSLSLAARTSHYNPQYIPEAIGLGNLRFPRSSQLIYERRAAEEEERRAHNNKTQHTCTRHWNTRTFDSRMARNDWMAERETCPAPFSLSPSFLFFFLLYLYARSDPRTNGINRWCCLFTNRKRAQPGHGQSLCSSSSSTETKSNPPLMAERAVVSNWSNPLRQSDWDSEKELAPKRRKRCTDSTRKVSAPKTWHDTTGIGRLDSPNKERAYWSGNERCLFLSFLLYWTKRISASRRTMVGFCTLGSFLLSAKSHRVSPSKLCRHVGKGEEEDIYLEPSPLPIHRYYIGRSTKEWTTTIENPHFALFMKDSVRPLYSMHSRTLFVQFRSGLCDASPSVALDCPYGLVERD